MDWMKAQASTGSGVCVEVARTVDGRVAMRHSKNLDGPVLKFSSEQCLLFVEAERNHESENMTERDDGVVLR